MSKICDTFGTLAIDGGVPARKCPGPPMYPGGMAIDQEEEQAVLEVLRTKRLFRYYGPEEGLSKVAELEEAFAAHMGAHRALAVTSGTAALLCGLQGIGVGPGDEVIVPAYTWIASASAVLALGAVPVPAEIDESLTLDPEDAERRITSHTKAIMPVHMRGAPCRMDEIMAIARRHDLRVIEDTAQADGGSFGDRRLGSIGDVGCFSLQFNKIITAGEGGMVITNDDTVWMRATMFHDVAGGQRNSFPPEQRVWGINFRMPELLGAVMLVQLRRLDGLLEAMRARKQMLKAGMQAVAQRKGIRFRTVNDPVGDTGIALVFFTDSSATAQRISRGLNAENIGANVIYHPEQPDYHIYCHWESISSHASWTAAGAPWCWAHRDIRYTPDVCPRTLHLLGRAVQMDVSPLLSNEDIEEILEGATRVLEALG